MAYVERAFEIPDPTPINVELLPNNVENLPQRDDDSLIWHLSGNQDYVEIMSNDWSNRDLLSAFDFEEELIADIEDAADVDAAVAEAEDALYEDPEWPGLDIGVGGAVLALNWLGCVTTASCNGGAYGGKHHEAYPLVVLHATRDQAARIIVAAAESGCSLHHGQNGSLVLHANLIRRLPRFARRLHENEVDRRRSSRRPSGVDCDLGL